MLSGKYNFSAEEGLKLYEESVKKVKKVKKVEVEDIFVEMSRIEGVVVDNVVVKEKKARTEKQEAAFDKMKAKRAEMLKEKKESGVVVEKVIKEKKVKVIKEEKEKKPRTEKQQAAFDKMKAKRAENLKAKKDAASVVSTPSDSQVEKVSEAVERVSQEDEVRVRKFSHEGKEYLISNENTLYDPESEEAVGRWNADSRKIEAISELEEEEIVE